jgi:adenylate cyclase
MPVEIERKFLVRGDAWREAARRSAFMLQGYLSPEGGKCSVRVRIEGDVATLGIKAAVVGPARAEYTYEVPVADARELIENLCVGVVEKVRHWVEHDGHTWEVDEFGGANEGLVTAELELGSEDEAFRKPAWLGREVTQDQRYYNHQLALHPYSAWRHS